MPDYADPIARLITELKKLPNIGHKTAERLAFSILRKSKSEVEQLARAILEVKERTRLCSACNNFSDVDPCHLCTRPDRTSKLICVVEEPHDILAIERAREFKGRYHVLHGVISPINGIGPESLKLKNLLERIKTGEVQEVIIATNPTVDGEATAAYLSKFLKPLGVKVTRIALGVPVGSDLDLADEVTIWRAIEGRREL